MRHKRITTAYILKTIFFRSMPKRGSALLLVLLPVWKRKSHTKTSYTSPKTQIRKLDGGNQNKNAAHCIALTTTGQSLYKV